MQEPDTGPQPDYAVNPTDMSRGIDWFLSPVIRRLQKISGGFTAAHDEVATARDSEAAGWFGGEGNGEVKAASGSFLNEARWQLQQLKNDQTELLTSLQEYETMLKGHLTWARDTDQKIADRFRSIDRDLEGMGH